MNSQGEKCKTTLLITKVNWKAILSARDPSKGHNNYLLLYFSHVITQNLKYSSQGRQILSSVNVINLALAQTFRGYDILYMSTKSSFFYFSCLSYVLVINFIITLLLIHFHLVIIIYSCRFLTAVTVCSSWNSLTPSNCFLF